MNDQEKLTVWMAIEVHPHDGWENLGLFRSRESALGFLDDKYTRENREADEAYADYPASYVRHSWKKVDESEVAWRNGKPGDDGVWRAHPYGDYALATEIEVQA